jgi:hypothetical protein
VRDIRELACRSQSSRDELTSRPRVSSRLRRNSSRRNLASRPRSESSDYRYTCSASDLYELRVITPLIIQDLRLDPWSLGRSVNCLEGSRQSSSPCSSSCASVRQRRPLPTCKRYSSVGSLAECESTLMSLSSYILIQDSLLRP